MALLSLTMTARATEVGTVEADDNDASFQEAESRISTFVLDELRKTHPEQRAEVTVGKLNRRLALARCGLAEAFVRPGLKLAGRTFVGYRCQDGANWSTSVPVQIRLFGLAVVPRTDLPAMQRLESSQFMTQELDLADYPGPVATRLDQVTERQSQQPLSAGRAIVLSYLHTMPVISQGDAVKVVAHGRGFSVTTEGIAQNAAAEGENVRVRTESGRVLNGTAQSGKIVNLAY
jgi:flagella basal body P-ring formation protein FlgA